MRRRLGRYLEKKLAEGFSELGERDRAPGRAGYLARRLPRDLRADTLRDWLRRQLPGI